MRKVLLTLTVLAALVLSALPAHAATYEFKDAEGDATDLGVNDIFGTDFAITPSDDQFDITKVALSTDKAVFTYAVSIKALAAGRPTLASGYYFRLAFDYDGIPSWFIVAEDATGAKTFTLRPKDTTASAVTASCKNCTGVIDRKAGKVIVKAPIASLAAAMKAAGAKTPLGPGSELINLEALAQRQAVAATLTSDDALAPAGVAFKL